MFHLCPCPNSTMKPDSVSNTIFDFAASNSCACNTLNEPLRSSCVSVIVPPSNETPRDAKSLIVENVDLLSPSGMDTEALACVSKF